MDTKKFEALVDIQSVDMPSGVILNGVVQTQKGLALVCPNCETTLFELGNVPYMAACEFCNKERERLYDYCPSCGQKLRYNREVEKLK